MGKYQTDKVDKSIMNILAHYGRLDFTDLWYELGESGILKELPTTKGELLRRLEFLASKGFVKSKGDVWILTK